MKRKAKQEELPDFEAVNPRYAGKKGSDMARVLLRPKDPKVREALDRARTSPDPSLGNP
ncbi:MAG: hypothetical protein OXI71_14005 [Gemmatimonadota bacterium]|nr:hypothetical protein [Gemmatimonadota bacterium]